MVERFEVGKWYRIIKDPNECHPKLADNNAMNFIFTRSKWKVRNIEEESFHPDLPNTSLLFFDQPNDRAWWWGHKDFIEVHSYEDIDEIDKLLKD